LLARGKGRQKSIGQNCPRSGKGKRKRGYRTSDLIEAGGGVWEKVPGGRKGPLGGRLYSVGFEYRTFET